MAMGDGSSILDYMPLTGPYRAFAGEGGDDNGGCMPSASALAYAEEHAPNCDGSNYDPDYVPPYMNYDGCNACGYDKVGVGQPCPVCNIGHGIAV